MKNQSLVVFTVLSQMAAGAFLLMTILYQWVALQKGLAAADQLTVRAFLALILVAGLGMLSSFFHLGTPGKAWRALTNLPTSWLSREILFTASFSVLGALFVCFQWFQIGSPTTRNGLVWIVAACGIALVFSMARVYMLPTISIWNTPLTMLSFYTTMLLLGGLAGAALGFAMALPGNPVLSSWTWFNALRSVAILIIFLIGLQLLVTLSSTRASSRLRQEAGHVKIFSPRRPGLIRFLELLRLLLIVAGAGLMGLLLFPLVSIQATERALYAAFALVLISELLGRQLFYEAS